MFRPSIEDLKTITQMNTDGCSMETICEHFGVGWKPIRRIYGELGLKNLHKIFEPTEQDLAAMKAMYEQDEMTTPEIGKLFGVHGSTIARKLKAYGVDVSSKFTYDDATLKEFKKRHLAGEKERDLAKFLGAARIVAQRLIRELGLKPHINGKLCQDPEKSAQVLSLYNDGYGTCELAEMFDVDRNNITRFLKLNGIDVERALTDEEKQRVLDLRALGEGTRNISKALGRSRNAIKDYLYELGIYNEAPPPKPPQPPPTHKICTNCKEDKPIEEFFKVKRVLKDGKVVFQPHPKCHPCRKLRSAVSSAINERLKRMIDANGKPCKKEGSCLDFLPYTILELKQHIETLFAQPGNEWMTWENWGAYVKNLWDDTDISTWTWQLDHITPHCTFLYTSMSDPCFKECWALSNLRPISAKQNIHDNDKGARLGIFDMDDDDDDEFEPYIDNSTFEQDIECHHSIQ